jgi:hypothetical protein
MDISLRGYEVAKSTPTGWEAVSTWRPTDRALNDALKSCAWLNERQPHNIYTVRAVISIPPPQPQLATQEEVEVIEALKAVEPAPQEAPSE